MCNYKTLSKADLAFLTQKGIAFLEEVDSTNAFLKQKPELTAVLAAFQTSGRGQRGASWESEPYQNLLFSRKLTLELAVENFFVLNIAVSLAVYEAVCALVPSQVRSKIKIKWPNDVFFEHQKIAGLLIENSLSGRKINKSIVGIGLNLNQLNFQNPHASSLRQIVKEPLSLPEAAVCVNSRLEEIQSFSNNSITKLLEKYKSCLYQFRKEDFFYLFEEGILVKAKITNVFLDGHIELQSAKKKYRLTFKSFSFKRLLKILQH